MRIILSCSSILSIQLQLNAIQLQSGKLPASYNLVWRKAFDHIGGFTEMMRKVAS